MSVNPSMEQSTNPSTQELRDMFWATPPDQLRTMIESNQGYQRGIFIRLGSISEHPLHSELVDFAIACVRYDIRKAAEAKASSKNHTRRHHITATA